MKKKISSFATATAATEILKQILEVLYGKQIRYIEHDIEITRGSKKSLTNKTGVVIEANFVKRDSPHCLTMYFVKAHLSLSKTADFWVASTHETVEMSIRRISIPDTKYSHYTARFDSVSGPWESQLRVINETYAKPQCEMYWWVGTNFQNRWKEQLK